MPKDFKLQVDYKGYIIVVDYDSDGKETIYPTHKTYDLNDDGESTCPSIESCIEWIDEDIRCRKKEESQKKCFNCCPSCNATCSKISWGDKEWSGTTAYQNATCRECDTEFTEVYKYSHSEIDEPV